MSKKRVAVSTTNFDNDLKMSGLNGYMSKIDKCDYVKSHLASRTIFRKRLLHLRDYTSIKDSVVLSIRDDTSQIRSCCVLLCVMRKITLYHIRNILLFFIPAQYCYVFKTEKSS